MRYGVCTAPENAALLEKSGYDYIELSVASHLQPEMPESEVMPALKSVFSKLKIKPEAFNNFLPADLRVTGPDIDKVRQEAYVAEACRRASSLGGEVIVFGSGGARRVPDGFSKMTAYDQIVDFLTRVGPIAGDWGLTIVIEPLCAAECNILNGVAESMEIVERVGSLSVKVLSDLFHVATDGQSYRETTDAGKQLAHVHVATRTGRRAPMSNSVSFIEEYFRAVLAAGYDGRVSVEGNWNNMSEEATEVLSTLQTSRRNAGEP